MLASVASAATYRLDINAAEGVKFAPWGNAVGDLKAQAINGTPQGDIPGVVSSHGSWFIIEADQGETINLRAMQGNSLDTYGILSFTLPEDQEITETRDITEIQRVDESVVMGDESVEGETVIKTVNKEVKIGEEEVVVDMMDAPRMFSGDICRAPAGALQIS